jgi:hypothetical protein
MMGYSKSNTAPLLKRFLARADDLLAGIRNSDKGPRRQMAAANVR